MTTATITATEFKRNFGKYLDLVKYQDFRVTKNGKVVGLWTGTQKDKMEVVDDLAGSIHATIDLGADRDERRRSQ